MNYSSLAILCGMALLLCLAAPVTGAVTPLWVEPVAPGTELTGVVISEDGSTIITGGDHLIALSRNGAKRWTSGSGSLLDISRDGKYILVAQRQVVRLISGTGTLIWEQPMDTVVEDISMAPDASVIAVTGGGLIRTMTSTGETIASNTTMAINHIRVTPSGKEIVITTSRGVLVSDPTLLSGSSDTDSAQDLVEIAPDGSSFVTATNDRIRMYSGSGGLVWDQKLPHGTAHALAYSGDGSTIVVGMDDAAVRVLNNKGTLLWTANATNWITSVAVSNDGNTVAAGSLDKKVHIFNHAGIRLGVFPVQNPVDPHSVAVTGDGNLIVVVGQTAVYGLSRSSFIPEETGEETITEPSPEITGETTTALPTVTTSRKPTSRLPTVPTPYPPQTQTPEAALLPAVPVMALALLLLYRAGKR
jgi:WD40 repeat protein